MVLSACLPAGPALIHSLWARIEQGIWAVQGIRWQDLMWLFLVWLCVESGIAAAAEPTPPAGPLARYVAQPDASYAWQVRRRGQVSRSEYVELTLHSQTWRDIAWKHQLFLVKPSTMPATASHAMLCIVGGSWKDEYAQPAAADERLPDDATLFANLAETLKTPVAVLLQVPHQPIFDGQFEDQAISYTFEQFLKTGDPQWPLLLPMVKSAVRGMDATEEFCGQEWSLSLKSFTVTGASKRGWTTWLTAAVDRRVTALAPMVIDVLNMSPQMEHQRRAWGKLSYKISDYSDRNLIAQLESPAGKALRSIVDPYSYRQRLKQPKLIIIGTNDHYWPLDALNLYWQDLQGPKYILYVPNNRHGLKDLGRVFGSLRALHRQAVDGQALPQLTWKLEQDARGVQLEVGSDIRPDQVQAWVATSPTRDFREARFRSVTLQRTGDAYRYQRPRPAEGYLALFGEALYNGDAVPSFFSTNVEIVAAQQDASQTP